MPGAFSDATARNAFNDRCPPRVLMCDTCANVRTNITIHESCPWALTVNCLTCASNNNPTCWFLCLPCLGPNTKKIKVSKCLREHHFRKHHNDVNSASVPQTLTPATVAINLSNSSQPTVAADIGHTSNNINSSVGPFESSFPPVFKQKMFDNEHVAETNDTKRRRLLNQLHFSSQENDDGGSSVVRLAHHFSNCDIDLALINSAHTCIGKNNAFLNTLSRPNHMPSSPTTNPNLGSIITNPLIFVHLLLLSHFQFSLVFFKLQCFALAAVVSTTAFLAKKWTSMTLPTC